MWNDYCDVVNPCISNITGLTRDRSGIDCPPAIYSLYALHLWEQFGTLILEEDGDVSTRGMKVTDCLPPVA